MAPLASNVHVHADGSSHFFESGSIPPAWASALITNPGCWVDGVADSAADVSTPVDPPVEPEPIVPPLPQSDGIETNTSAEVALDPKPVADPAPEPAVPPKKGASASKWREYALSAGFAVDDPEAKASDIRSALVEAGVPVE